MALLQSLSAPPESPLIQAAVQATQFASLLFASLIRSSARCKQLARNIKPSAVLQGDASQSSGQFFVPADGPAPPSGAAETPEDDEPPQTLLAVLTEHLSLAFLSRTHSASSDTARETREWDRLIISHLALLSQWLWEDPKAVRDFLENGGMGMVSYLLSDIAVQRPRTISLLFICSRLSFVSLTFIIIILVAC